MARRKQKLGASLTYEEALERLDQRKRAGNPCRVTAGSSVTWDGELTEAQCGRFPPGKLVGKGSFAGAYEDREDAGRVVKFTSDANDAKAARVLLGKKLKGAVHVLDVAQLRGQTAETPVRQKDGVFVNKVDQPVYAITTERVRALPRGWSTATNVLMFELESAQAEIRRAIRDEGEHFSLPTKVVTTAIDRCMQFGGEDCRSRVLELSRAVDELGQHGVFTTDLHSGNWGMRGDQPVILDFGVSQGDDNLPIDLAGRPRRRRKARR